MLFACSNRSRISCKRVLNFRSAYNMKKVTSTTELRQNMAILRPAQGDNQTLRLHLGG